jgi:gliding motility-associated-like protein
MKIYLNKILIFLFLVLATRESVLAQSVLSVPNYTACPNQIITASATWNNVSSITYSLFAPPNYPPAGPTLGGSFGPSTFTVSSPVTITYTLVGNGVYQNAPITSSVAFTLTIVPPAAMTLTYTHYNCYGSNVQVTAPIGGASYGYSGVPGNGTSPTNVITLTNVNSTNTGALTVVSVIAGCTVTGVANISVAPLKQLAINTTSNVCEGGSVNLTANLPGSNNDYQWLDNFNSPMPNPPPFGTNQNPILKNLTINNSGVYIATVNDLFNGILCPYSASTQVNVVQTFPVIPIASPNNVVCQGANLNLSASAGGGSIFSWQGPGFTSNIANPVISPAVPTNDGNYTVTASFPGQFIVCTTTAAISVSVVPVSVPVINMPNSVCQNTNFLISGSAASNPGSFTWAGPAIPPGSSALQAVPVVNVQPNASGTQFLTVTFALPVNPSVQCPVTTSVQLNVVPVNTVTVIPPGPVCSPANAFLQALATGANQYQWVGPNGFNTPGANVFVYYPTPSASGIYTVTAYFGGGSNNLVCTNNNTVQLTVNPVLNFSLVPRQQVCYNTPLTITGPSGATSYTWTSSTGYTSNNKDVTFTSVQPNNSGTYTLNVSLGPCISGAASEIVVLDPVQFTLTPFSRTVCRGDTIILEGGASGGSENYGYTWNPSVYMDSPTGPKQTAIPLGSVIYNLLAWDIACPNYSIATSCSIKVNQPPLPDLHLNIGNGQTSEACSPLCLYYDSGTENDSTITTYDFGGNLVSQHNAPFNYCLTQPGTYNLKIYSKGKNGCGGTYQYPYPIIVNPTPGSDVTWLPETPTPNDVITFYPTAKNGPVTYYSWSFLGGATPGDTSQADSPTVSDTTNVMNPTRVYDHYGSFPVVLISTNDKQCSDTVIKLVKVIDALQVYIPNSFTPNGDGINDVFIAKGTGMKVENFSMDIFNRAGQDIFSTKDINQGWDGKVQGQYVKDATYIYDIKVVGMNGEGRKEYTGYITVIK